MLVDNALERTPLDCVLSDNREGARAAVEHLLEHGHQRLAFVGGPSAWLSTRERQEGYEQALAAAPRRVACSSIRTRRRSPPGWTPGRSCSRRRPDPTAVFAVNDAMALG